MSHVYNLLLILGVDYKKLMSGEDPLSVLKPALVATNVHVAGKLATKIPCKVCMYIHL